MTKTDEDILHNYVTHMVGKHIIGCGTNDNDEFEIALNDGSVVVFFSDNDLNMVIEFSGRLN